MAATYIIQNTKSTFLVRASQHFKWSSYAVICPVLTSKCVCVCVFFAPSFWSNYPRRPGEASSFSLDYLRPMGRCFLDTHPPRGQAGPLARRANTGFTSISRVRDQVSATIQYNGPWPTHGLRPSRLVEVVVVVVPLPETHKVGRAGRGKVGGI